MLEDCNVFVQFQKDGPWLPAIRAKEHVFTPGGLKIVTPFAIRSVSSGEITDEMASRGEVLARL